MSKSTYSRESFDGHMVPIRNRKLLVGETQKTLRTNAVHRNTYIDPASLRSHQEYNWRTGECKTVHADILDSAIKHMTNTKIHTVTSARRFPDPVGSSLYPAMSSPAVASKPKSKSGKRKR